LRAASTSRFKLGIMRLALSAAIFPVTKSLSISTITTALVSNKTHLQQKQ
jgi:hypothetical protein